MYGTSLLLEHFTINMEQVLLEDKKSSLMENTINQLFPLLNALEAAKKKRRFFEK